MALARRRVERDSDAPAARRAYLREYFGGLDLPAALVGMLTSVALVLVLGGIVTAIADANFNVNDALTNIEEATASAAIASLLILVVAFGVGGWAAGRMARFDGVRNGVFAALLAVLLSIGLAALTAWAGSEYNLVPNFDATRYVDEEALTTMGIVGGLLALAAIFISSALGGMWGERYHRVIDREMVALGDAGDTRLSHSDAAVATTPVTADRSDDDTV